MKRQIIVQLCSEPPSKLLAVQIFYAVTLGLYQAQYLTASDHFASLPFSLFSMRLCVWRAKQEKS